MAVDGRTILDHVAMGRITAEEGEQLLIRWNEERKEGRELRWVFAACIAISLLQWLPGLVQSGYALLPGSVAAVCHALLLINHVLGGML